jgi:hypothetical protein
VYNGESGENALDRRTVTQADLRHGYKVNLDTTERRMLGGMSDQERFRYWEALVDRPEVRKEEAYRIFPLPTSTLHRVLKSSEEVQQVQRDQTDAGLIGQMGGLGGAGTGQVGLLPGPAGAVEGAPQEGVL